MIKSDRRIVFDFYEFYVFYNYLFSFQIWKYDEEYLSEE